MHDDPLAEILRTQPLINFSIYTQIQANLLRKTEVKILEILNNTRRGENEESVVGIDFEQAYGLFWLWLLGAYEVTRTMAQHKKCFTDETAEMIVEQKKRLSKMRIPFAKQELAGRAGPIYGELSISGTGVNGEDMVFVIEGDRYSVVKVIESFRAMIDAISVHSIKHAMSIRNSGNLE